MKFYIAIPVYKAEAFLSECVSSVLSQTCQDFEIVLVDDGSPDGSGKLCNEFAARDSRIHAIHQKNTGPYGARRTAIHFILDHGSPEDRAVFLDADDSLKPEALETLARCIQETGADLVFLGEDQVYEGKVLRPFPRDMAYIGTVTDRRQLYKIVFQAAPGGPPGILPRPLRRGPAAKHPPVPGLPEGGLPAGQPVQLHPEPQLRHQRPGV